MVLVLGGRTMVLRGIGKRRGRQVLLIEEVRVYEESFLTSGFQVLRFG